jgi:hypothetical protein
VLGGISDVATVLIGGGSGAGARSAVENLLAGFVKGLMDADTGHRFRCLTVCEGNPERYEEIKRELFRLSSTPLFDELEVTFFEERLPPVAAVAPAGRQMVVRPDPVYLLVRQEGKTGSQLELRTSLLGAGGKATVVSGVRQVKRSELEGKLDELQSSGFRFDRAPAYGRELAGLVISDEALAALGALKDRHVVVVHDAESSRIPWELLAVPSGQNTALLAKDGGLSRRYVADNLSVAKWLEERRQDLELNMLLVVNPTLDLDGAEEEGRRVRELLAGEPAVRIDELRGRDASRPALERAFRSGKYDVIHYAGHASSTKPIRRPAASVRRQGGAERARPRRPGQSSRARVLQRVRGGARAPSRARRAAGAEHARAHRPQRRPGGGFSARRGGQLRRHLLAGGRRAGEAVRRAVLPVADEGPEHRRGPAGGPPHRVGPQVGGLGRLHPLRQPRFRAEDQMIGKRAGSWHPAPASRLEKHELPIDGYS